MTRRLDPAEIELSGLQLIEASAGTGKTYTIEQLYVRLLVEKKLDVDNILVVTFTNAATSELRDRIRLKLLQARKVFEEERGDDFYTALLKRIVPGEARDRIDRALKSFDLAAIHTIHGFCTRILTENAFESGSVFESDVEADIQPLIEEAVNDLWVSKVYGEKELFVGYLLQKGVGPQSLTRLAKKIHSRFKAEILPAPKPLPDIPDRASWDKAYEDCKKIWAKAGAEILAELLRCAEEKILSGTRYKVARIPEWCTGLDDYFGSDQPLPTSLPEKFENFTSTTLTGSVNKTAEKKGLSCPSHPFFEACELLATETAALHEILDAHILDLKLTLADEIRNKLPPRMKERNLRGYDDILRDLDDALQSPGRGTKLAETICGLYKAALIDEFQDTDPVQYRIFQKIHKDGGLPVLFIGDPKQAIYSFRGADIFSYLEAKNDAGNNLHTLDTNWRSDPMLVKAVNTLFAARENPFKLEQIPYHEISHPEEQKNDLVIESNIASGLEITWFNEEYALKGGEARISGSYADEKIGWHLCNSISSLLDGNCRIKENPVQPKNIAVLVRNGKQGQKIQQALREVNIPSVVSGGGNIFKTPEIYELYLWLTAITDPSKDGRLRAALCTSLLGLDTTEVAGLENNESTRDQWINKFHDWNELWSSNGFISLFRDFMESKAVGSPDADAVQARILSRPDGERCLTNLLHAAELIHAEATARKLGPAQLMGWIESRITSQETSPDAEELRMESDAEAVQIVTIHSSKGLEYPIVFCPYSAYGNYLRPEDRKSLVYHDKNDDNKLKLNISPIANSPEEARVKEEILQEDLRLFYVALTRARNRCTISWGGFLRLKESAPYWLLNPESEENSALHDAAESLCNKSEGSIRLQDADDSLPVPRPREETQQSLSCREATRQLSHSWRTSSYSGLTRKKHYVPPHLPEGQDHDDGDAESTGQDDHEATLAEPILLEGFGGGVVAGNCFHAIYEHLDFTESDPAHLEDLARKHLDKYGLDSETWLDKVCETIRETIQTPLDPAVEGLELSAIDTKHRLDEMNFLFPLSQDRKGRSHGEPLDTNRLAEAFASAGAGAVPPEYPGKIEALGFRRLRGFLTGSIDLAFEFKDKWYIADYKSNSLGNRLGDYGKDKTAATMVSHHYILQYHLYTVALHRYLQARLQDYDYEKHFGGVYYLFIKGMKKTLGPGNGIFMDRPSLELINKLDDTFRGGLS